MDVREKLVELLGEVQETGVNEIPAGFGCTRQYISNEMVAAHLISRGITVQEWVSVDDRLPTREDANETESILAINKDERYVGRWVWDIVARWPTEFTYWMPIPQPQKGE